MSSTPAGADTIAEELDEALRALTHFDADRLEAMEARIREVTVAHLACGRELLPELVGKHAVLGQLLEMTAANLKVLGVVLHLDKHMDRRMEMI